MNKEGGGGVKLDEAKTSYKRITTIVSCHNGLKQQKLYITIRTILPGKNLPQIRMRIERVSKDDAYRSYAKCRSSTTMVVRRMV
jgi:hypothetical protein